MGFFRNDDDRACAGVMKLLLENAPKELRAQVQRELDWDTSIVVEDAITAVRKEQAERGRAEGASQALGSSTGAC